VIPGERGPVIRSAVTVELAVGLTAAPRGCRGAAAGLLRAEGPEAVGVCAPWSARHELGGLCNEEPLEMPKSRRLCRGWDAGGRAAPSVGLPACRRNRQAIGAEDGLLVVPATGRGLVWMRLGIDRAEAELGIEIVGALNSMSERPKRSP